MKYNIKDGDKQWIDMIHFEWKCDDIKEEKFDENSELFPVVTSDDTTFYWYESNLLGVAASYKFGEELDCNKCNWLGVYEWYFEGITEGTFLGNI